MLYVFVTLTNIDYFLRFSLYTINVEQRLQVLNTSEIPVQISWRIYNKSEQNKPFGVILDMLTPDKPNDWSLRINRYYGSEWPKYFKVRNAIDFSTTLF